MVREPCVADFVGHLARFKDLSQNREAPVELASHDAMSRVGRGQRPAAVPNRSAQKLSRVFELKPLDARRVGALKQKADHRVGKTAVDELFDHRAKGWFSADGVKCGGRFSRRHFFHADMFGAMSTADCGEPARPAET